MKAFDMAPVALRAVLHEHDRVRVDLTMHAGGQPSLEATLLDADQVGVALRVPINRSGLDGDLFIPWTAIQAISRIPERE
jgi:hypothetical protein